MAGFPATVRKDSEEAAMAIAIIPSRSAVRNFALDHAAQNSGSPLASHIISLHSRLIEV